MNLTSLEADLKRMALLGILLMALTATACGNLPFVAPPATPTSLPTATPTQAPPTKTPAPTPTATTAPTATATAIPTPANPSDALSKIFKGWANVKSFRAKLVMTTTTPATTSEMDLEAVLPDSFHMTSKAMELIVIGKTFYIKVGNKWQKLAVAPQGVDLSLANPKNFEANLGATSDIKFVGVEMLDGKPTTVYQYTTNLKGPPAQKYTSKVWVGVTDGLPHKIESEPKAGQKTIITFTDYNANITIKPPV